MGRQRRRNRQFARRGLGDQQRRRADDDHGGNHQFLGVISGALSPDFEGNASLSGLEDNTGSATLDGSTTVANSGTYDIVANTNVSGTPASSFINDGLFEKTGGGGVSDVTTNFINSGTLNVLSGSIAFSGGFTNTGVIHGLVTQNGAVTTVSAPVPSDFNGDSFSDIFFQNAAPARPRSGT